MPADAGGPRLSESAREVALTSLLEGNPDAWVAAVKPSGYFTDLPDGVPLRGQRVIRGASSTLELVVPGDRRLVVDTWARAMREGGSNAVVHPFGVPGREVGLHFLDLTRRYGVYVAVFLGFPADTDPQAAEAPVLVPRTSVFRKDQTAVITEVDEAATAILGWRAEELLGTRSLDLIHPDDQDRGVANWMEMLSRPASSQRVRLRHRHQDGSWVWLEVTNHNRLNDPHDPHVQADVVDVTEEVTALEALRVNERLLRRLTEALPVGVLYVGADGGVDYGNERLAALLGVGGARTVAEQFATAVGSDREVLGDAVAEVLADGRDGDVSVMFAPAADVRVHCDVSLRGLLDEAGDVVGAIVCVTDTTEDFTLREELREQARYDLPTGCLNHASVLAALAERLPPPAGELTVAMFIDIDDFKGINDRHGHAAGDAVLRHVADRLHQVARPDDLVGRLGGDEFLLVVKAAADRGAVAGVARRVSRALNRTVAWGDEWILPRASIGVAAVPNGSVTTADALVSAADSAMYESKRHGGRPVLSETPMSRPR